MSKQWLKTKEAADLLGLSVDTIRNWITRKHNPLPAVKAGRDWLIKEEDLNTWLDENKNTREDEE